MCLLTCPQSSVQHRHGHAQCQRIPLKSNSHEARSRPPNYKSRRVVVKVASTLVVDPTARTGPFHHYHSLLIYNK